MNKKSKSIVTKRQMNIAEIVWEAISRNREYQLYYQKGPVKNAPVGQEQSTDALTMKDFLKALPSYRDWGLVNLIPPGKRFAEIIEQNELTAWILFNYYVSPIYSHFIDNNHVSFEINLHFPRTEIERKFRMALTTHIKEMKETGKLRHQLRLIHGKSIDMKWYRRAFALYDRVEKKKEKMHGVGKKKIYWKTFVPPPDPREKENHLNAKVKKINDAYNTIKELVEGGFRLIT